MGVTDTCLSVIPKSSLKVVISTYKDKDISRNAIFRMANLPELLYRVPSQASWPGASIYTPFQLGCYPQLPFGFKIVKELNIKK